MAKKFKRQWEYKVTVPRLPVGAISPVMDFPDMEDWLDGMDAEGWEFVGYGQKNWNNTNTASQSWWIFRRPFTTTATGTAPA